MLASKAKAFSPLPIFSLSIFHSLEIKLPLEVNVCTLRVSILCLYTHYSYSERVY